MPTNLAIFYGTLGLVGLSLLVYLALCAPNLRMLFRRIRGKYWY